MFVEVETWYMGETEAKLNHPLVVLNTHLIECMEKYHVTLGMFTQVRMLSGYEYFLKGTMPEAAKLLSIEYKPL